MTEVVAARLATNTEVPAAGAEAEEEVAAAWVDAEKAVEDEYETGFFPCYIDWKRSVAMVHL